MQAMVRQSRGPVCWLAPCLVALGVGVSFPFSGAQAGAQGDELTPAQRAELEEKRVQIVTV